MMMLWPSRHVWESESDDDDDDNDSKNDTHTPSHWMNTLLWRTGEWVKLVWICLCLLFLPRHEGASVCWIDGLSHCGLYVCMYGYRKGRCVRETHTHTHIAPYTSPHLTGVDESLWIATLYVIFLSLLSSTPIIRTHKGVMLSCSPFVRTNTCLVNPQNTSRIPASGRSVKNRASRGVKQQHLHS